MQQSRFIDDGKDSISQSSAVLSERTINLKKEITKLDDEIMQLQSSLQNALHKRMNN